MTQGSNVQSSQVNDLLDMDSLAINDKPNVSNPVTGNSGATDLLDDLLGGGPVQQQQRSNSLGMNQQLVNNVKIPYCVNFIVFCRMAKFKIIKKII